MLNENAVPDTQQVGRNPIHRQTQSTKAAMHDYKVAVGNDQSGFVLQLRRNALYKVEKSFAPRFDVRAVLDVMRDQNLSAAT